MTTSFACPHAHPLKDVLQRGTGWHFLAFINIDHCTREAPCFVMTVLTLGIYLLFPIKSPHCMAQNQAQPKHRLPLTFPFHITLGRAGKALTVTLATAGEIHPPKAVGTMYSIPQHQQTQVSDKTGERIRPEVSRCPVQPLKLPASRS